MPGSLTFVCSSLLEAGWHEVEVPSHSGDAVYQVVISPWGDSACDCPGFHYRGRCSHIQEAIDLEKICDWTEEDSEEEVKGGDLSKCPKCGRQTVALAR